MGAWRIGKAMRHGLGAVVLAGAATQGAVAQELAIVDCAALNLPVRIDFESFPRVVNGTRYDEVLRFPGALIGERFAGQALSNTGTFDLLGGSASAPLALVPGAPGRNLSVEAHGQRQNTLYGLGPEGFERKSGSGEGAISMLFETDQAALGFTVEFEMAYAGSPPAGTARFQFFARDGRLLGAIDATGTGRTRLCFQRAGAATDIAGVSITNTDIQGISIDDIAFETVLVLGRAAVRALPSG